MFGRILLASDGSDGARRACSVAAGLSALSGAPIRVVAVATEHGTPTVAWSPEPRNRPVEHSVARQWCDAEAALLRQRGIEVETVVLDGPIAEAVAKEAAVQDCGVIVIGRRGASGNGAPRLGSVANRLLDLADRPLLIVP